MYYSIHILTRGQYFHTQKKDKKIIMINVNGDNGAPSAAKKFHDDHKLTMEHYYVDSVRNACKLDHQFTLFMRDTLKLTQAFELLSVIH